MKRTFISFLAASFISFSVLSQQDIGFEGVYQLINQNNFFKAKDVYSTTKNNFSPIHQQFIEAFLDHAFGKHNTKNKKLIDVLYGNIIF